MLPLMVKSKEYIKKREQQQVWCCTEYLPHVNNKSYQVHVHAIASEPVSDITK